MRLFRGRVFTLASILSFIVGFAMIGSITFLPTLLQFVSGASATSSGLRMLPLVIGLLLTAIASGTIVGRTGKYRMFPIAGAAITARRGVSDVAAGPEHPDLRWSRSTS